MTRTPHDRRVPPPVLFAAAWLLQGLIARRRRVTLPSAAAGAVLGAAAAGLAVPAVRAFRRRGTTLDPEHPERASALVTDGAHAVTRNPMYLALTLALLAHAAVRRSVLALLPAIGFAAAVDRVQIRAEEAALHARFGRAYDRYRRDVPRWIGRGDTR